VASSVYDFDGAGRLTNLTHHNGSSTGTTLVGYGWTYDSIGRLTAQTSGWNNSGTWTSDSVNYAYDARGQLTSADYATGSPLSDEGFTYDDNGNRESATLGDGTSQSYSDPAAYNRVHFDGTYTYSYDAEGNRTARWVDEDDDGTLNTGDTDVTEYQWDNRNRMTQVTHKANFSDTTYTSAIDYIFDAQNRRIGSLYETTGDGVVDREERYVWDGQNVVLDFVDSDGDNNSLGGGTSSAPLALDKRYLTGSAVDQVFAQEAAGDGAAWNVLWMLADHLGSNRDLAKYDTASETTSIVTHYTIDTYGNVTVAKGNLSDTRYIWAQTQYDLRAGQYYAMARWYDPRTGGFVSEDPIGFQAGDANVNRYCENGPTNGVDPGGLVPLTDTKRKEIRANAKKLLATANISSLEKELRYWIVDAALTSQMEFPEGRGQTSRRDTNRWRETKDGFVFIKPPSEVLVKDWIQRRDSRGNLLPPATLSGCKMASELCLLKGLYLLCVHQKNKVKYVKAFDKFFIGKDPSDYYGNKSTDFQDFSEDQKGIDTSTLLPGDQVWIKNGYWTDDMWDNPKYKGEQGTNMIYAGDGIVVGPYGKKYYTFEEVPHHFRTSYYSVKDTLRKTGQEFDPDKVVLVRRFSSKVPVKFFGKQ